MYDVVTIGSVVLDVTIGSKDFRVMKGHQIQGGVGLCEVYGGKTEVDGLNITVGGGGTNSAVSFLKKGLKVGTVVKMGSDEIGGMMKVKMDEYGISEDLVVVDEKGQSALSVILVAPDGGRSILTFRGVSKELTSSEIKWEKMKTAKWFYVSSLGGNMSLLEDIVSFAGKEGIKVAINPGKAELKEKGRLLKVLPKVEVMMLNRMELGELLGVSFDDDPPSQEALARQGKLLSGASELVSKTGVIVVTEGKKGAVAVKRDIVVRTEAFKVKSVDDTGAGDAFGSGFVYGMIKGWSLADSLKAGAANGAGEVMKIGVKEGVLTDKELDKWMKRELRVVEEKVKLG